MNHSSHSWAIVRRDVPDPTDTERVRHMLEAIDRLEELTARFAPAELLTEELPQSAGCRCFGIIGEAAAGTSPAFQHAYSVVDWQRWRRYGRRLVREYYQVNYRLLWRRWQPETLLLRQQLLAILAQEQVANHV